MLGVTIEHHTRARLCLSAERRTTCYTRSWFRSMARAWPSRRYPAREPFARQATVVLLETVSPTLTPSAEALITTAYVPTPVYVQERSETEHYCAQATHYLYTAALTYLDDRPWESAVAVGPPAQEIVESSTERGVDLIVMATHGRVGRSDCSTVASPPR